MSIALLFYPFSIVLNSFYALKNVHKSFRLQWLLTLTLFPWPIQTFREIGLDIFFKGIKVK